MLSRNDHQGGAVVTLNAMSDKPTTKCTFAWNKIIERAHKKLEFTQKNCHSHNDLNMETLHALNADKNTCLIKRRGLSLIQFHFLR